MIGKQRDLQRTGITRARPEYKPRFSTWPDLKRLIIALAGVLGLSSARAQEDIDLTDYTLVFEDNFDTLSVANTDDKGDHTWFFWPPYGPAGAFSASHWMTSRMECQNGVLINRAEWNPNRHDPFDNNWESGCLSSMDKRRNGFAQRFGYWSAKMKMPDAGQGAWCAFWLASASGIPSAGTKGYEIDIVEAYGGQFKEGPGGDKYNWVVHPWNADGSQAPQPYEGGEWEDVPGGDAINNWHIYGCKVAPDFIIFYIDGQEVGRKPTNLEYLEEPLYIIINYALQQPLSGEPFVSKGTSALQVDWVRAYSLPNDFASTSTTPPRNLRIP
jgi:beta-glucanase (GH16 family)